MTPFCVQASHEGRGDEPPADAGTAALHSQTRCAPLEPRAPVTPARKPIAALNAAPHLETSTLHLDADRAPTPNVLKATLRRACANWNASFQPSVTPAGATGQVARVYPPASRYCSPATSVRRASRRRPLRSTLTPPGGGHQGPVSAGQLRVFCDALRRRPGRIIHGHIARRLPLRKTSPPITLLARKGEVVSRFYTPDDPDAGVIAAFHASATRTAAGAPAGSCARARAASARARALAAHGERPGTRHRDQLVQRAIDAVQI